MMDRLKGSQGRGCGHLEVCMCSGKKKKTSQTNWKCRLDSGKTSYSCLLIGGGRVGGQSIPDY